MKSESSKLEDEVTDRFLRYREIVRSLWTILFEPVSWRIPGDAEMMFWGIDKALFGITVLAPLGKSELMARALSEKMECFRVRQKTPRADVKCFTQRPSADGNTYWDAMPNRVNLADVVVAFHSFYDFEMYARRDLTYVRGVIVGGVSAELEGRHILLRTEDTAIQEVTVGHA